MGLGENALKLELMMHAMGAELLGQLGPEEAAQSVELAERGDCCTLVMTEGEKLLGYAVIGVDAGEHVTVYMARSTCGMVAKAALLGVFGAAQVAGQALRVHVDTVKRGMAMARAMGAECVAFGQDGDGVPMGFFGNV